MTKSVYHCQISSLSTFYNVLQLICTDFSQGKWQVKNSTNLEHKFPLLIWSWQISSNPRIESELAITVVNSGRHYWMLGTEINWHQRINWVFRDTQICQIWKVQGIYWGIRIQLSWKLHFIPARSEKVYRIGYCKNLKCLFTAHGFLLFYW